VKRQIVLHDHSDMALQCGNQTNKAAFPSRDAKLVALAKAGDENAYAELIKGALPAARRAVRSILRAEADAEDALQEATIRSYFKLSTFDGRAKFTTWFTRIAINSALMILRKKRTSHEVSLDSPADSDATSGSWEVPDYAPNPEKRYAQSERENILRGAIRTLRPTIRKVIELQQLQEHSMKETAAMIGISVPAAKARLFHAKVALRKAPRLKSIRFGRANRAHLPFIVRAAIGCSRTALTLA